MATMIKVLFVCLGNICRSPMADAVFQQKVKDARLGDTILVDSAGTAGYHAGDQAHRGTLNILRKHNIPYNGRSRQLTRSDLTEFDYILAMDKSNLSNIRKLDAGNSGEVMLFLREANRQGLVNVEEVPDPYYDNRFEEVYELVNKGSDALLDYIRQQNGL